ncbi:TfoX/Sxy family protein [Chitinophaga sp. Mgbs1]|uniref:TfoX/Sxy family protein n=1 Tax=Chitinophaga solisilvae TaxID=1233460 RepID=A0A9Q5DA29_9BACT|nr:TfoX/Sxy family protein [Chitinophaga solisilvae]
MSHDEKLLDRVREILADTPHKIEEKKMFGGICFMVNDKMCVGVRPERLMVRLDPGNSDEIAEQDGCEQMVMGKRVAKGYFFISPLVLKTKKQLDHWIKMALEFNPKAPLAKKK